jgi:membrane-associated phospholipid phosphatase
MFPRTKLSPPVYPIIQACYIFSTYSIHLARKLPFLLLKTGLFYWFTLLYLKEPEALTPEEISPMTVVMTRFLLVFLITAALVLPSAAATSNYGPQLLATDILTAVVPLTGLVVAYFSDDTEGEKEWFRNTGVNQVLVTALRVGFNETSLGARPNGGSYAFPSGHVAFVMSGATFLGERYGWKWGAPAYMAAAYIAYTRVDEDKHHWRDVIAAGTLAYGVALLTVTPENASYLAPIIGPDFLGLRWQRSF